MFLLSFLLYFYKNCSSKDKSFPLPWIYFVFARIWVTYTPAGVDSHIGHIHTSWSRLAYLYFQVYGLYMLETSIIGEPNSSLPHKLIRGQYLRVFSFYVFMSTSKLLIRLVTRQYCFKLQENFPLHIQFIIEYVVHRLEDAIFPSSLRCLKCWRSSSSDGALVEKSSPTNFRSCPTAFK